MLAFFFFFFGNRCQQQAQGLPVAFLDCDCFPLLAIFNLHIVETAFLQDKVMLLVMHICNSTKIQFFSLSDLLRDNTPP